jgi:hypothetical protein
MQNTGILPPGIVYIYLCSLASALKILEVVYQSLVNNKSSIQVRLAALFPRARSGDGLIS